MPDLTSSCRARRRRTGERAAARTLVQVLLAWQEWTHRKVESVALLEGERARWRVSVDVTVPRVPWPLHEQDPRHTLVPLATIAKTDMRQFDATNDGGSSLPVLGADDNGKVATLFLIALIEGETGRRLTSADTEIVEAVVYGLAPESTAAAGRLVSALGLQETFSSQFLDRFAEQFLLVGLVPLADAGSRRVLKFSYQWDARPRPRGGARLLDVFDRALAATGLRPYPLQLDLGAVDTARSHHLEVPAPTGLRCVDLTVLDGLGRVVVADSTSATTAHVHTPRDRGAATALVRFVPELFGIHRLVTWSAWGVAALLGLTYWRLPHLAVEPGTPVALLLFGPALVLTLLTRPGENWIVAAVTGPLRALAVWLGATLFLAGFGLAAGLHPASHDGRWSALADLVWTCSIGLSVVAGIVLVTGRQMIRYRYDAGGTADG